MDFPEEWISFSSFKKSISRDFPSNGVFCGIDYGLKKVGIAISDSDRKISMPLKIIRNDFLLFSSIIQLIKKYRIIGFAVGLPLKLNNNKVHDIGVCLIEFCLNLRKNTNLPIILIDERMTSSFAKKIINSSIDYNNRKKKVIFDDDDMAASLILETLLKKF